MAQIKISIINSSSVLSDAQVNAAIPALQTQVSRDFAPAWGVDADLDFVANGQQPPAQHWWLVVLDNSDEAGALGYHDLTAEGLPLGKIFAGTDLQFGNQWTVTASHELLEMLVDPAINLSAMSTSGSDATQDSVGRLFAYEVCDACEADQDGYSITGVLVSDFVFPAWFEGFHAADSTQFDFQNKISTPFQLLPGGYISVYDITAGSGWQQLSGPSASAAERSSLSRAPIGSRRERRRTPYPQWIESRADAPGSLTVSARRGVPKNAAYAANQAAVVSPSQWSRFVRNAAQSGLTIDGYEGEASQNGYTFVWTYKPDIQSLNIRCLTQPEGVPSAAVEAGIRDILADCLLH